MVATLDRMPREKKEETDTVRLRKSMIRRIARIAAHRDVSVPDYLADRLGPLVDADEALMIEELKKERGEDGGGARKKK